MSLIRRILNLLKPSEELATVLRIGRGTRNPFNLCNPMPPLFPAIRTALPPAPVSSPLFIAIPGCPCYSRLPLHISVSLSKQHFPPYGLESVILIDHIYWPCKAWIYGLLVYTHARAAKSKASIKLHIGNGSKGPTLCFRLSYSPY